MFGCLGIVMTSDPLKRYFTCLIATCYTSICVIFCHKTLRNDVKKKVVRVPSWNQFGSTYFFKQTSSPGTSEKSSFLGGENFPQVVNSQLNLSLALSFFFVRRASKSFGSFCLVCLESQLKNTEEFWVNERMTFIYIYCITLHGYMYIHV